MKKLVTKESTFCDKCGKNSHVTTCIICGKEYCWDCSKSMGEEFKAGVHWSGSGDGYFCNECLSKPDIHNTAILCAYMKIRALRQEESSWYKGFNERVNIAEDELKILRKGKE